MSYRGNDEVELHPTWRNLVTIAYGVSLYVGLSAIVEAAVSSIGQAFEKRKEAKQRNQETTQE